MPSTLRVANGAESSRRRPRRRTRLRVLFDCLRKDPKLRLRDIGDAKLALSDVGEPPVAAPAVRPSARRHAKLLVVVAAGIALSFLAGRFTQSTPRPRVTRTSIALPEGHRVTSGPIITRDGRRVAFASTDGHHLPRLYTRMLDSFELRSVPNSDGADKPFFSPDGRWIGFFAQGRLFKADVDGGAPTALADAPWPNGGTWGDDGTIVFTPTWNGGLHRISSGGGTPTSIAVPDAAKNEYAYAWPHFLPGSRDLLFSVWGATFAVERLNLSNGRRSLIAPRFWTNATVVSGYLLIGSENGELEALPYPPSADASPVPVLRNVHWSGTPADGLFKFSVSDDGTLVYAAGDLTRRSLVTVDSSGTMTPISGDYQPYLWLDLAPDGRRVAELYASALWIRDLERGTRTPVDRADARGWPAWSADGQRLYFSSNHEGNWEIYSKDLTRPDSTTVVLRKVLDQHPTSVSPDGTLAYVEVRPGAGGDIWMLPPGGTPAPWLATSADEVQARFSPDGRLVVFSSNVSGPYEI
jgi:Tol biopolymer transport system component